MTTPTYPGVGPDGVYRLHAGLDEGYHERQVLRRGAGYADTYTSLSNASLWLLTNGGNVLNTKAIEECKRLLTRARRMKWERDNRCGCGELPAHFKGRHK